MAIEFARTRLLPVLLVALGLPVGMSGAAAEPVPTTSPDPRAAARQMAVEVREMSDREKLLIARPDRQRPEHPLSVSVFGRPLTIGGRYTVLTRFENDRLLDFDFFDTDNRDIDDDGDTDELEDEARGESPTDDQLRVNQALQLDLFYPFSRRVALYLESIVAWRNLVHANEVPEDDDFLIERGEMWLYFANLFDTPLSVQVGRQRFFDEREWWWDEDLDSVRLRADFERLHAEIAVAEQLLPVELTRSTIEREQKDVLQLLASANWEWAKKNQLGLFALYRYDHSSRQPLIIHEPDPVLPCVPEDEFPPGLPEAAKEFFRSGCPAPAPTVSFRDESDENLFWFGLSASGRLKLGPPGKLHYWLNAGGVWGKETFTDYSGPSDARTVGDVDKHNVSGGGVDLGLTFESALPLRPTLTIGYAFGSGKRGMTETSDRGFRQTGFQDNNDKFGGVASLRYYGELLDPELSNLHVITAGFGLRFLRKSSIDFVYHLYRQAHAAPFLRDADFKRDPGGEHRSIGQEWDLVVGIEEWRMLELKFVAAVFRTGKAFSPRAGRLSHLATLRLRLNF